MNNASGKELHLTWNTDRRVATPRFTFCPIAVLRLDVISASPSYGLASSFRDYALNTRQVLCILMTVLFSGTLAETV
jgi:hypothetical protein